MRLLVVFGSFGLEEWASVVGVISKFIHCGRFEVCVVAAQFVVCINLIQRILVPKKLILRKTEIVPLFAELVRLLRREVLAPAARVIPVVPLEQILDFLVHDKSVRVRRLVVLELVEVATLIACMQLPHLKIGLPHLLLLLGNVENAALSRLRSRPESLLGDRHDLFGGCGMGEIGVVRGWMNGKGVGWWGKNCINIASSSRGTKTTAGFNNCQHELPQKSDHPNSFLPTEKVSFAKKMII